MPSYQRRSLILQYATVPARTDMESLKLPSGPEARTPTARGNHHKAILPASAPRQTGAAGRRGLKFGHVHLRFIHFISCSSVCQTTQCPPASTKPQCSVRQSNVKDLLREDLSAGASGTAALSSGLRLVTPAKLLMMYRTLTSWHFRLGITVMRGTILDILARHVHKETKHPAGLRQRNLTSTAAASACREDASISLALYSGRFKDEQLFSSWCCIRRLHLHEGQLTQQPRTRNANSCALQCEERKGSWSRCSTNIDSCAALHKFAAMPRVVCNPRKNPVC